MMHGVLLVQLGTPEMSDLKAVRRYLRVFLMDRRVVDLGVLSRFLLVYFIIVPFRARQSFKAYQAIWTKQGSPLRVYSDALVDALQKRMRSSYRITLAMRYGNPSLQASLNELKQVDTLTILPLYPQYSSAATGSALEEILQQLSRWTRIPSLKVIRDFYRHPAYIEAQAKLVRDELSKNPLQKDSYLLFSYHGIPQRQITKMGCHRACETACPSDELNQSFCYRAQCYQTSQLLADALGLQTFQYGSSFQSRLGKTPWIKPYTDDMLGILADRGIKDLRVLCPSFVTDCLETLEEIGIRSKAQWLALDGLNFSLLPCLNAQPEWVEALVQIIES